MELLLINNEYFVAKCVLFETMSLSLVDFEQELEQYDLNCKKMRFDGNNIHITSVKHFLQYYIDKSPTLQPELVQLLHGLVQYTSKKNKRKLSRSLRIEIAYRQEYKCNICKTFPIPPTFEIDHIHELQDGGCDIASNLQALCPDCHRNKTYQKRLERNPLFQKPVPYEKYFQTRKSSNVFSKYFSQPSLL
jgi:5-methylcytosine-specific restriction endonuclease McrA|tara:strand:- start:1003 stop:1575 length:573 start_codon:yes stop_codon:yes gene_type:complete